MARPFCGLISAEEVKKKRQNKTQGINKYKFMNTNEYQRIIAY